MIIIRILKITSLYENKFKGYTFKKNHVIKLQEAVEALSYGIASQCYALQLRTMSLYNYFCTEKFH